MRIQGAMLAKNFRTSFLSCERDMETILKKLFVDSQPYSNKLKKLLVVNAPDCLDETQEQYNLMIRNKDLKTLKDEGYVRVVPRLELGEHEEVKSYLLIEFDDFTPSSNPAYRNCVISFTIMCNLDEWELDDYKLRHYQIAGYVDGIMNEATLTGIGTLQFMGAAQVILDEYLGGVILRYAAVHMEDSDDSETLNPFIEGKYLNEQLDTPNRYQKPVNAPPPY